MAVIKVDPASVKKYGQTAVEQFKGMSRQLSELVSAIMHVRYFGTNAREFKDKAGAMANEYSAALHSDMRNISQAVQTATSNISRSLGGTAIAVPTPGLQLSPGRMDLHHPRVGSDHTVEELDTAALEGLIPLVHQRFNAIGELLDQHLHNLTATKWEGQAKEGAVRAVRKFTNHAKTTSNKAKQTLTKYIRSQIEASVAADRSLA